MNCIHCMTSFIIFSVAEWLNLVGFCSRTVKIVVDGEQGVVGTWAGRSSHLVSSFIDLINHEEESLWDVREFSLSFYSRLAGNTSTLFSKNCILFMLGTLQSCRERTFSSLSTVISDKLWYSKAATDLWNYGWSYAWRPGSSIATNPFIFFFNTSSSSVNKRNTIPVAFLSRHEALSLVLSLAAAAAQKLLARDEIMSSVDYFFICRLQTIS